MTIEVLVRGAADAPAVFLLSGDPAREAGLRARLSERALSLVRLAVPDWNADLSPWPAPPACWTRTAVSMTKATLTRC